MQEKQVMVPKTVFETSDGKQFDNKTDAERWESILYFEAHMKDRYGDVLRIGYCVINSAEEAEILQTMSLNGYVQTEFYKHRLEKDTTFPIMVKFSREFESHTIVVTEKDYEWFKDMAGKFQALCTLYESISKPVKSLVQNNRVGDCDGY